MTIQNYTLLGMLLPRFVKLYIEEDPTGFGSTG